MPAHPSPLLRGLSQVKLHPTMVQDQVSQTPSPRARLQQRRCQPRPWTPSTHFCSTPKTTNQNLRIATARTALFREFHREAPVWEQVSAKYRFAFLALARAISNGRYLRNRVFPTTVPKRSLET